MTHTRDQTDNAHPFLRPLVFPGGGRIRNRILPGPMEGILTGSFCAVLARLGYVSCWITPFIRISTAVPRRARLDRRLAPFQQTGVPVIAQIMGTDANRLTKTAERLAELGVVAVDLNCGCPSPTVVRSGAGGERLRDPDWLHAVLSRMRNALPECGLTVKLRSGFEHPDEMPHILAAVTEADPDAIILHYRTVSEQYRPVKDGWRRLACARDLLPNVILVGSGDLFSCEDALRMQRETGVDGVAPARGLLRNPRLLVDIEQACRGEQVPPFNVSDALTVLRAMVNASEQFPDGRPGFALELAGHILGRSSSRFKQLTQCPTLHCISTRLDHLIQELEEIDDS